MSKTYDICIYSYVKKFKKTTIFITCFLTTGFVLVAAQTPIIQQPLRDVVGAEGKPVRLEIVFSASPPPQVTWYRGIDKITQSNLYKVGWFTCLVLFATSCETKNIK